MGTCFGMRRGLKEVAVRLRFAKIYAPYVLEREWHPTQVVKTRRDGSLDLSLTVNDLLEVKRWVLSWGAGVEVLAPRELRREVREDAMGTARMNR